VACGPTLAAGARMFEGVGGAPEGPLAGCGGASATEEEIRRKDALIALLLKQLEEQAPRATEEVCWSGGCSVRVWL
jgi:hypothetical protein